MKKMIFLSLLFLPFFADGNVGSKITFEKGANGKLAAKGISNELMLPLVLVFPGGQTGEFKLLQKGRVQPLNGKQEFGKNGFVRKNNVFTYTINQDGKTDPGEIDITEKDLILEVKGGKFKLHLGEQKKIRTASVTDNPAPSEITQEVDTTSVPELLYYDAIKLSSPEIGPGTKQDILKAYRIDDKNIDKNNFLKEFKSDFFVATTQSNKSQNFQDRTKSLISQAGNLDVTNLAAGLARFLAERTKDELNEAFFQKMKDKLNEYPELKTIFPKTTEILNQIETYSYASVIQVLKENFETDVQNLPENIYNLKSLDPTRDCPGESEKSTPADCQARLTKLKEFFETQPGTWIGLGMFTVKEAFLTENAATLIHSAVLSDEFIKVQTRAKNSSQVDYNVSSAIALADLLSQGLRSNSEDEIWVNKTELRALLTNNKALMIFFGLLVANQERLPDDKEITFYDTSKNPIRLASYLNEKHKKIYELELDKLVQNIGNSFSASSQAAKKILAAVGKNEKPDPQVLYAYYRTFVTSSRPIAHSPLIKNLAGDAVAKKYDQVASYLEPAVDMAYHISVRSYSSALYDGLALLNNVKSPAFEKPVVKSFIKYGTLISTVASAESSEEVKKAIEASVLPVGSYSIKRKAKCSISLNSFVGPFWSPGNTEKSNKQSFGLFAPIGFNFSGRISKKCLKAGGWGVNLQLFDLGALVNYYLINGDTTSLPNDFKVRLSNIFAPGGSLNYNIAGTPLTLGFGGQYIPALYQVDQIKSEYQFTTVSAWRWQFSLMVDIPLFNLKVWD